MVALKELAQAQFSPSNGRGVVSALVYWVIERCGTEQLNEEEKSCCLYHKFMHSITLINIHLISHGEREICKGEERFFAVAIFCARALLFGR